MGHMDFITKRDIDLDRDEDWKLLGYWPEYYGTCLHYRLGHEHYFL
jgi:hypothetical protein